MKTKITVTQKTFGFTKPKSLELISVRDNNRLPFSQMIAKLRVLGLFALMMIGSLSLNSIYAQIKASNTSTEAIYVKGNLSDEFGPLKDANIILKGTDKGTTSNENGTFVFPEALKKGDVLVFSHLGLEKAEIEIDETTTDIQLVLYSEEVVIVGALDVNKPYRSKR